MTDYTAALARLYVAFDDTDTIDADRGTGKVGRWFEDELPVGCTLWGVVRQQLLVHPDVPFTSHNSSAVCVVDVRDPDLVVRSQGGADAWSCLPSDGLIDDIVGRGVAHLERNWMEGSDPGLCVVAETSPALAALVAFGRRAAVDVVAEVDAYAAARGAHLSGHGGTEDGVTGAAAPLWPHGRRLARPPHRVSLGARPPARHPRAGVGGATGGRRHHGRDARPRRPGAAARRARRRRGPEASPTPLGRPPGAARAARRRRGMARRRPAHPQHVTPGDASGHEC